MTYRPGGGFVKDSNNSSTSTLTASSTFTGTATDVLAYNQIHVVAYFEPNEVPAGDGSTAKASMYVDFGPDATNWDIQIPLFVRSGIFIPQTYIVVDRYFRVRWINDGGTAAIASLGLSESAGTPTNQTAFRLNSYLGFTGTKDLGRTVDQSVSGTDPVGLMRTIIMGKDPDGATYNNVPTSDAGELIISNYGTEVTRGNLPGKTAVRVYGRNDAVGTTEEDLWGGGATYNFLTSAATLRVKAGGNAADTAAGAGARGVELTFLDSSGNEVTETLATAGASASAATSSTALRLNQAMVSTVGTYGVANTGAITIETSGGTTVAVIPAGTGEAHLGVYSIPTGKKGYLRRIRFQVEGNKDADVFVYRRENFDDTSAPMNPKIQILRIDQLPGGSSDGFTLQYPIEIAAKSDVWMSSAVATGTGKVNGAMEIEVVDD